MSQVVDFSTFAYCCHYFNPEAEVNGGYGCMHPEQENTSQASNGEEQGCCYSCSCPLSYRLDEESLSDSELDLDGRKKESFYDEDGRFSETEAEDLSIVTSGASATEDQKKALDAYNRYLHRYDKFYEKKENKT